MGIESVLKISASGMKAQMMRMEVHSANIANINSTRTPEGGPYRRKEVVFETTPVNQNFGEVLKDASLGVEVTKVVEDQSPFRKKFDPNHPDAGPDGYVLFPNVDVVSEMIDMQEASRSYEANISAILSLKSMISRTFEIGRR
ncbi:MAG: flagellar basal body rod protein FlgC [Candidatus Omnitrophota bacterium]